MQLLPVQTRILTPPQDDLLGVLEKVLVEVKENDVVLISSKVVAIHEGACVSGSTADKASLIQKAASCIIPRTYWPTPLTVAHHTFLGGAGIDESNGDGYFILLPEHPFASAKAIRQFLCTTFGLQNLGVVITDSHSQPFRYGATGVAIGWWGIEPVIDHRGQADLFGRSMKIERSNVVDGLAAGATVEMGEVNECTPIVIARDVPRLTYTDAHTNTRDQLFIPYADDTFRVLYEPWLSQFDDRN